MEKAAPALAETLDSLSPEELIVVLAEYLATRRQRPDAVSEDGFRKTTAFVLKNLLLGAG